MNQTFDFSGDIPILRDTDKDGREYLVLGSKTMSESVIAWHGQNVVFKGFPRLMLRRGDSVFGEQLVMQFYIKELAKTYEVRSEREVIEIYFSREQGIEYLKRCLAEFEKVTA